MRGYGSNELMPRRDFKCKRRMLESTAKKIKIVKPGDRKEYSNHFFEPLVLRPRDLKVGVLYNAGYFPTTFKWQSGLGEGGRKVSMRQEGLG